MRLHRAVEIAVLLSVVTFAGSFLAMQHVLRMTGVRINVMALEYEAQPERLSASQLAKLDLSSALYSAPLQLALQQDRRLYARVDTSNLVYLGAAPTSESSLESLESFVQ